MLIRRDEQRTWFFLSVGILATATVGYLVYVRFDPLGPRGGSWPGIAYGVVGFAMMLFAGLLTPRKKMRIHPLGKMTFWMKGHLWLGFLCLPMILFHAGFEFGGLYTSILMVLLLLCWASGIYGLVIQQLIPRMMMNQINQEMIYERIDPLIESLAESGEAAVKKACGQFDKPLSAHITVLSGPDNGTFIILPELDSFVFGRESSFPAPISDLSIQPRHFQILRKKHGYEIEPLNGAEVRVQDQLVTAAIEIADGEKIVLGESILQFFAPTSFEVQTLKSFFIEEIQPYLTPTPASESVAKFRTETDIRYSFGAVRRFLASPALIQSLDDLMDSVLLRRELFVGKKLHHWLHTWLIVHIPLAAALLLGGAIHAVVSLVY